MGHNTSNLLYLVTIVTFIWALRDLSNPARARGVASGSMPAGMALRSQRRSEHGLHDYLWMVVAMAISGAFGAVAARRVKMTAMPQMVALFNGVGGSAAALISWAEFHRLAPPPVTSARHLDLARPLGVDRLDLVCRLDVRVREAQELIGSRPITYPAQRVVNGALFAVVVGAGVAIVAGAERSWLLAIVLGGATLFGFSSCCRSAAPTCRSSSRC